MPSQNPQNAQVERRRRGSNPKIGKAAQSSWADVPLADEPSKALLSPRGGAPEWKNTSEATPFGPSILKEIFPDHGKVPEQILDRLPSPSRARRSQRQQTQILGTSPSPVSSPMHGMPPQSPMTRTSNSHCDTWQAPQIMSTPPPAPVELSYRERLRAGGRGALQRGWDAGYVPRTSHQEWGAQNAQAYGEGYMTQQSGMMDYGMAGWNGQEQMPSDDYWGTPMNSSQYPHMQQGPMQEASDYFSQQQMVAQPQMSPQPQDLLLPLMSTQPQTQPMQMGSMTPHGQCPQMTSMQMQSPHMELANAGEQSPAAIDRCMAIVMPGASQFPCDNDLMALQLKAAAELDQCYED